MALFEGKNKFAAIFSTLFWALIGIGYYFISSRYISSLTPEQLSIVNVKFFGTLITLKQFDYIVYTFVALKIFDSWFDGLVNTSINILVILILIFGAFLDTTYIAVPFGVLSIRISYGSVVTWIQIQILWILLLLLAVQLVKLAFDIAKIVLEKRNRCVNWVWEPNNGNYEEYIEKKEKMQEKMRREKLNKMKEELDMYESQLLNKKFQTISSAISEMSGEAALTENMTTRTYEHSSEAEEQSNTYLVDVDDMSSVFENTGIDDFESIAYEEELEPTNNTTEI